MVMNNMQRQYPPIVPEAYGQAPHSQMDSSILTQLIRERNTGNPLSSIMFPPALPQSQPAVQSMERQSIPSGSPASPLTTLVRSIPMTAPPLPEANPPGFPEALPRDYSPYYMAERQAAPSPIAPWMETDVEPRPTLSRLVEGIVRQPFVEADLPSPVAPEMLYENSHRGRMEQQFHEGIDPAARASVMQMRATANEARDTNSHTANRYNQNTGQWYTETTPGKYRVNQYGNVPLTEQQQANREARESRREDFYVQRKQDAELRGLPPLTRFIAKQMGGEGGLDPLLLATADPRLGQMAAGMQQAQAGNQLQRDLAEGQRTSEERIANLNANSRSTGAIHGQIMQYLTAMGVNPATAMPIMGEIINSIQFPGLESNLPAAPQASQGVPQQQPSGQPAPLTKMLNEVANSTAAQNSRIPATETPERALEEAMRVYGDNPTAAMEFLAERGVGRESLANLLRENTRTPLGDAWRWWRGADWYDYANPETMTFNDPIDIGIGEMDKKRDFVRKLLRG